MLADRLLSGQAPGALRGGDRSGPGLKATQVLSQPTAPCSTPKVTESQVWKFVPVVLVAVVPVELWAGRRAVHSSTGCLCLARHGQWHRHLLALGELDQGLGAEVAAGNLPFP